MADREPVFWAMHPAMTSANPERRASNRASRQLRCLSFGQGKPGREARKADDDGQASQGSSSRRIPVDSCRGWSRAASRGTHPEVALVSTSVAWGSRSCCNPSDSPTDVSIVDMLDTPGEVAVAPSVESHSSRCSALIRLCRYVGRIEKAGEYEGPSGSRASGSW